MSPKPLMVFILNVLVLPLCLFLSRSECTKYLNQPHCEKTCFFICENKEADQRYIDSFTMPLFLYRTVKHLVQSEPKIAVFS